MSLKDVVDTLGHETYEIALCVIAAAIGWFVIGGIAKAATMAKARGVVIAVRLASALLVVAIVFRVFTDHSASWFAHVGDYFHPVLTMLSLLGLAAALYYQRLELREAQKQSTYARHRRDEEIRRHRLADASFVFVNEIRFVAGEYQLSIVCGGAAVAMNVLAQITFGSSGEAVGVNRAVMLPGEKLERTIRATSAVVTNPDILVGMLWSNVHGMHLSYRAKMTPAGTGFWRAPERVDNFKATAAEEEVIG